MESVTLEENQMFDSSRSAKSLLVFQVVHVSLVQVDHIEDQVRLLLKGVDLLVVLRDSDSVEG
jgi:hypothetical protein